MFVRSSFPESLLRRVRFFLTQLLLYLKPTLWYLMIPSAFTVASIADFVGGTSSFRSDFLTLGLSFPYTWHQVKGFNLNQISIFPFLPGYYKSCTMIPLHLSDLFSYEYLRPCHTNIIFWTCSCVLFCTVLHFLWLLHLFCRSNWLYETVAALYLSCQSCRMCFRFKQ